MSPRGMPSSPLAARELVLNATAPSTLDGLPLRFESPEGLRIPQIVLVALCVPLITLVTVMRVYTQKVIIGRLGMEDYTLIVAFVFMIIAAGFMFHAAVGGYGTYAWTTEMSSVLVLLKASIILQCLRIFAPHGRADRLMYFGNWTILVSCIIAYTTLTFVRIIDCSSHGVILDHPQPGLCVDRTVLLLFYSVWNFVSNFVILALPLGRIWRLRMPRKDKINLSLLFGIGGAACIATAFRIYYSVQLVQSDDFTWYAPTVALTGISEATFGFFCACLPVLPKFLQYMRRGFVPLSPLNRSKSSASYNSSYRSINTSPNPFSSSWGLSTLSPVPRTETHCIGLNGPPQPTRLSKTLKPREEESRCASLDSGMRRYVISAPMFLKEGDRCSSLGRQPRSGRPSPTFQAIDEELASSFHDDGNNKPDTKRADDAKESDVLMRPEAIHPALRPGRSSSLTPGRRLSRDGGIVPPRASSAMSTSWHHRSTTDRFTSHRPRHHRSASETSTRSHRPRHHRSSSEQSNRSSTHRSSSHRPRHHRSSSETSHHRLHRPSYQRSSSETATAQLQRSDSTRADSRASRASPIQLQRSDSRSDSRTSRASPTQLQRADSAASCASRFSVAPGRTSAPGERPVSHIAQLHFSWQDERDNMLL